MRSCLQFESQSVLDHGLSVRSRYCELRDHLLSASPLASGWRLPRWTADPVLSERLRAADDRLVGLYQVYHDCGKPLCAVVDADGRRRFPGHADASRARWIECSDGSLESREVAELIGMDMDVHLLRPAGVEGFSRRSQAAVLLATGLCELHSNAVMFGGTSSEGFRVKWRRMDVLGGRVVSLLAQGRAA